MMAMNAATPPANRIPRSLGEYDLVVIGAGILGLAHAWHARDLGLRTAVVERDSRAVGASVRNFGHACVTAQHGVARDYAELSRTQWLRIAAATGLDVREVGTLVVARHERELDVMTEFVREHGDESTMLSAEKTASVLGVATSDILAGTHLPRDLRLDPLVAVDRLANYLGDHGVDFYYSTNAGAIETGLVTTNRGVLQADYVAVTVGHDIDRLFPDTAAEYEITRCRLRMLEVDTPRSTVIDPAIFTGLSLLRYDGFLALDSSAALRAHLEEHSAELLEHDINLMFTQRPDGSLIVGDTHHRDTLETPFEFERSDELLLRETARLFDVPSLRVRRRWRGLYASSEQTNFLSQLPIPRVRAASVTTGIGMTTSLGFAQASLDGLLAA